MSEKDNEFNALLDQPLRWPKAGDRLLKGADSWDQGIEFSQDEISRNAEIWAGYMRAGDALLETCEREPHDRHFLIYPALFSYRHGLELAMKWVIDRYGGYARDAPAVPLSHNLWHLWELCRRVIVDVGSDGENEALLAVEQVVKDFYDLDRSAIAFRYSYDKQKTMVSLPGGTFDVPHIRGVMEGVGHFFEGVDGQLDYNASAGP